MNRVLLVGRLTAEPLLKYNGDSPLCSFTIAVDREPQEQTENEKTDFINCVCWNSLAINLEKHNGKGNLISVVGKLRKKTIYNDRGDPKYITEVYCEWIGYLEKDRKKVKFDGS